MKLIYVAGPYRAKTEARRDLHLAQATMTGVLLAEKGWFPVIPHLNTAKFEDYAPWLPDEFYLDGTLELMRKCDAVCLLPGYEFSEGTAGEIAEARRLFIPVYTSEIKVPPPELSVPVIPPETVPVPRKPEPLEDEPE